MKLPTKLLATFFGLICGFCVARGEAATISLNFSSGRDFTSNYVVPSQYPLSSADVAGVVPVANWNNLGITNPGGSLPGDQGGESGTVNSLVDSTGTPTNGSVTWSSNGTWTLAGSAQLAAVPS